MNDAWDKSGPQKLSKTSMADLTDRTNRRGVGWVMLAVLFVMEAVLGLQGFCMADEGWSLSGYQQIFNNPESVKYIFLFYNSLWIGGIWECLFGWMGIAGFRLLGILFMLASWTIVYRLLRDYINHYTIFLGSLLVALAHNYGVMVFDHSSVTVFMSVLSAYFLFRALQKSSSLYMFGAGACIVANVFSRIPNISMLSLFLLLIPYYMYTRKAGDTLKLLGTAVLGLAAGTAAELALMASFGHLSIFIDNLSTGMSAATADDSSHNIYAMLKGYLISYLQIIKDILKIGLLPAILYVIVKRGKLKSKGMHVAAGIILAIAQIAIFALSFDNMLFLYAFTSIVLFPALYYKRGEKEVVYLILIALIILFVLPYGSDFGINNMGENAIWIATPLAIGIAADTLRNIDFKCRHIGAIAFITFIMVFIVGDTWHIMNNAYFDEGPRYEKHYKINNPLATTFTKESYAKATDHILEELKHYVHEDDYLFCFQSRPMLHYLTRTRPYMYNPWPWSFDTAALRLHLGQAERRGGKLPVLVREKTQLIDFTAPDPDWDSVHATDNFGHKNAKVQIIHDFIQRHDYKVVWQDKNFQILLPRQKTDANEKDIHTDSGLQ